MKNSYFGFISLLLFLLATNLYADKYQTYSDLSAKAGTASPTKKSMTVFGNEGDIISFAYEVQDGSFGGRLTYAIYIDKVKVQSGSVTRGGKVNKQFSYAFLTSGDHTLEIQLTQGYYESMTLSSIKVQLLPYYCYTVNTETSPHIKLESTTSLVLNDNVDNAFVSQDTQIGEVTYKRTFNNTNWQALYIPFSMSYDDWKDDFEVAEINAFHQYDDDSDGVFDRTELEVLKVKNGSTKPNCPYIIRALTTGAKEIVLDSPILYETKSQSIDCSSVKWKYTFTGIYDKLDNGVMYNNGYYALSGGKLMQAASATTTLKPYRWYLSELSRTQNGYNSKIRNIDIVLNEPEGTTSISKMSFDYDNSPVFNLNGQNVNGSVSSQTKGIYIKNGKKYLVK